MALKCKILMWLTRGYDFRFRLWLIPVGFWQIPLINRFTEQTLLNQTMYQATGKGHSYIARLHCFKETFKGGPNLGIKNTFYRKGGRYTDTLPYLIKKMNAENHRPQVALLQNWRHDLDKQFADQHSFFHELNRTIL